MTSLGRPLVARTRYNDIRMDISGDLSFSYAVLPIGSPGVGIPFYTKKRALEFARETGKLGWKRQVEIFHNSTWMYSNATREQTAKFMGGEQSPYVRMPRARKYLPEAYGEYAEKLRKKYHIKAAEEPKMYLDREQQREVYADFKRDGYQGNFEQWKQQHADLYEYE